VAATVALSGWWALRRIRRRRASLAGQVAIVTGGSRGLGFLIARELAREGCRVVICARGEDGLDRARDDLRAGGADVTALPCDVSDSEQVEMMVSETLRRFGRIDVLVNDAGIIQVAPIDALSLADFHRAMDINFWGTVNTTLAVLPEMRARKSGRIVNITSIGGKVAVPHLLPYDCAKFAAVGFSEGLCAELARVGVSVTTVVPGLMRTGSHRFAEFRGKPAAEHAWFGLAAATPGLAMSAQRAARRIVAAAKRRKPEIVIGVPAKLLRLFKELFPTPALRALSATNRLLPKPRTID
jgi:NAD(P)-dependent dehydrogenase (short-subunit alcohol dehydrogenase family)